MSGFKLGDKVQTRDGRPARILADDLDYDWPIVAAVRKMDGLACESVVVYSATGLRLRDGGEHPLDLVWALE